MSRADHEWIDSQFEGDTRVDSIDKKNGNTIGYIE